MEPLLGMNYENHEKLKKPVVLAVGTFSGCEHKFGFSNVTSIMLMFSAFALLVLKFYLKL